MSLSEIATLSPLKKCTKASVLMYAGQYEQAMGVLDEFWRGVGERPELDQHAPKVAAELLLQCGSLSGFLADARGKDAHEKAKDLLTEARRMFESCGNQAKVSEANHELGICYVRQGAFDEARIVLKEALEGASGELYGKIIIGKAIVELLSGSYEEAKSILMEAKPFFDSASDALKGRWHGHMGLIERRMARGRIEFLDRAIIEFTAAIYHYELAGHIRYCGGNLNNLAPIFYKLGRYTEAHEHLDRARQIFYKLNDQGNLAQVEETRTRALIAEGRYRDAWRVIIGVVDILERGGECALLVDALTCKAIIQARLGDRARAARTFAYAIKLGEESGALFNAGLTAVSMMEELTLSNRSLYKAYRTADAYLSKTQDEEVLARLHECAHRAVHQLGGPQLDKDFSLPSVMRQIEARFIEEALTRTDGRITKAASLLGISHQALHRIINKRQKQLLGKRRQVRHRRKSIIKKKAV